MQGSVDVSVGYGEYYQAITTLAYAGGDSENDSDPVTDWFECQNNARSIYDADTVLSSVYYAYGGGEQGAISYVLYDDYGSRYACVRFGWRLYCYISNAWKANGNLFKLRIGGYRVKVYNTGSPTWTFGGNWDDFGRMYFKYSEDANLFSSGGDLMVTFGDDDFYIDTTQLNSKCRAAGDQPWSASPSRYLEITLDKNYIKNMVGNDLYIWMKAPYYTAPFYHPYDWAYVKWCLNPYRIYTYY